LACPTAWALKWKPKRSPKASISGAIRAFAPVPAAITTLVLSTIQRRAAPPKRVKARVKNALA
jgi:hypothetical protein